MKTKNVEHVVDALHIEDLRIEGHLSFFDENEEYDILIVRLPVADKVLSVKSLGFVYTSDNSFFCNKAEQKFEAYNNRFEGPHQLIDKVLNRLLKAFTSYQDTVANMGKLLYANNMTSRLKLKHDLLRIEYILSRTSSKLMSLLNITSMRKKGLL